MAGGEHHCLAAGSVERKAKSRMQFGRSSVQLCAQSPGFGPQNHRKPGMVARTGNLGFGRWGRQEEKEVKALLRLRQPGCTEHCLTNANKPIN